MTVRTRIAPSPTGEYHIGNMRTALYDYALAKKHNGQFIVRIEDTDRNRYIEGADEKILQVIKDYGLNWDEGPGVSGPYEPYYQSQRLDLYKNYAQELVEKGHAYYCFCTTERLQKVREEQQARGEAKTRYDGHCRNLSQKEIQSNLDAKLPHVIRLKAPKNEKILLHDIIHGDIEFDSKEMDDTILLKSDGFPTYHLAAMVDDHLMNITHILRGIDWMPSSPIHVLIYKYLGWDIPDIAHLPNLKEKGANVKLSKRHGSVSAIDFLQDGYLPEALINFLMFTGWNPGTEKEIYTLDEFVQDFSLEKVQKTDLVTFDRDKLIWYNGYYIRQKPPLELMKIIKDWAKKFDVELKLFSDDNFNLKVLGLVQERMKTLSEFSNLTRYFFEEPELNKELVYKQTKDINISKEILHNYYKLYESIPNEMWNNEKLDLESHKLLQEHGYNPKDAFMTIRTAVTGETATPPLFNTMELLGKPTSIKRIARYL